MKSYTLDNRLMSAASFVRQGAVFADIGTDHAHLPIFLLKEGKIKRAVLADINEGPLASAARNAESEGVSHLTELVLTDGAAALSGRGITDYAICGMGGELIARIISSAPHLKAEGVRLILIPMSRQATLRTELAEMGFSILEERYTKSSNKYYVCMLAEYTGNVRPLTEWEAELGLIPDDNGGRVEYIGYLKARLSSREKALCGRASGTAEYAAREEIVLMLKKRISEMEELLK